MSPTDQAAPAEPAVPAEPMLAGDLLPEETIDWIPSLSGLGPEKIVTIFNPASVDFRVVYARTEIAPVEPTPGLAFARERGLGDLGKAAPQRYSTQSIILKSGQSVNLPGDLAQIATRKLITYILGVRTGHRKTADPIARRDTEKEIVISIKDASDFLNQPAAPEKLEAELRALNPEPKPSDTPNPPPGQGVNYVSTKDSQPS